MKKLSIPLTWGLIFFFGALGLFERQVIELNATSLVHAAPSDVYCVIPATATLGVFAGCTQVFTSIQAAVDAAGGGEEIRVATGTYTDVHQTGSFTTVAYITKSLELYGGYSDGFTTRNPDAHPTILDAQLQGWGIFVDGAISVTVDGFEITGGSDGSGLATVGVTATIRNNNIHHNIASVQHPGQGGGVVLYESNALLEDNRIYANIAARASLDEAEPCSPPPFCITSGGGVFILDSTAILRNNQILSNTAAISGETRLSSDTLFAASGGGLTIINSDVWLSNNLIQGNVAATSTLRAGGGGIYLEDNIAVTMTGNIIQDNTANTLLGSGDGGGVAALLRAEETMLLENNRIQRNTASMVGVGVGGGLALYGRISPDSIMQSSVLLRKNQILSNTAAPSNTASGGGGVALGGVNAELTDNLIQHNQARDPGGGLYMYRTNARLTNNAFIRNEVISDGAAIAVEDQSNIQGFHNTFHGISDALGNAISINTFEPGQTAPSTASMTNTILANYAVGISLTVGNILTVDNILWHQIPITISASPTTSVMMANQVSGDPAFASDGYHLTAASAAIGHGIPAGVPADIDGQVRRAIPDLGADEYWDVPPTPRVYFPLIMKGK